MLNAFYAAMSETGEVGHSRNSGGLVNANKSLESLHGDEEHRYVDCFEGFDICSEGGFWAQREIANWFRSSNG